MFCRALACRRTGAEQESKARWRLPAEIAGFKTTEGLAEMSRPLRETRRIMLSPRCALVVRPVVDLYARETHPRHRDGPGLPCGGAVARGRRRSGALRQGPSKARRNSRRTALPARDCGADEGAKWRNEMQSLITPKPPTGERRRKIVAAFNRGYHDSSRPTAVAPPPRTWLFAAISKKAPKISRDITARYAN